MIPTPDLDLARQILAALPLPADVPMREWSRRLGADGRRLGSVLTALEAEGMVELTPDGAVALTELGALLTADDRDGPAPAAGGEAGADS